MASNSRQTSFSQWLSLKISSRTVRNRSFVLSQRNIYIFPTKAGFAFLMMLGVMLLTAINYQSSMVYLMTFVLGAVFFVSIWLCFLNLLGLQIEAAKSEGVFAGEPVMFRLRLQHPSKNLFGVRCFVEEMNEANLSSAVLEESNSTGLLTLMAGEAKTVSLRTVPAKRGIANMTRLGVNTTFPFGMIRAWTWLPLDCRCHVYPQPVVSDEVLGNEGEQGAVATSSGTPENLKEYKPGDSLKRVHWKKYAANEQLLVKSPEGGARQGAWLRWSDYQALGKELGLSVMCERLLGMLERGEMVGLQLDNVELPPGSGAAHRTKCLQALAEV